MKVMWQMLKLNNFLVYTASNWNLANNVQGVDSVIQWIIKPLSFCNLTSINYIIHSLKNWDKLYTVYSVISNNTLTSVLDKIGIQCIFYISQLHQCILFFFVLY